MFWSDPDPVFQMMSDQDPGFFSVYKGLWRAINGLVSRFEHRRHTSVAMNRNYSETCQISIPADKNNKAIILDVGGKKHKIRSKRLEKGHIVVFSLGVYYIIVFI